MLLFAQVQSQLQGKVPSPRNQLPFCSPNKKYAAQNMALFCPLTYCIFMWKPQRVSFFYKDTDVEQRVSTFNLRVNYLLIFGAFTWIFLSIRSTTGLCNHPELIGQEHTLLPVPFLEGYKMLLPGSAGSNMSLCGFKEKKEALPDGSQV